MKSLTICLTPEEVEQRLSRLGIACSFSAEEHAVLSTTPIVNRADRVFAFPTPAKNQTLNLKNIKTCLDGRHSKQTSIFEHSWYETEQFMTTCCPPGWHVLFMDVLAGSIQQSVNYLDSASTSDLHLPLAAEVVLMLLLHYEGSGEQLLMKKHSWCSDVASLNRHVTVGAFGRNGIFISGHPAGYASRGLGICPKFDVLVY